LRGKVLNRKVLKNKSIRALCFLGFAVVGGGALANHHWDDIAVTVQPLRNGVYALMGEGGNLAVSVGEDGTFLVDDQYAPLTGKIIAAIATIDGSSPKFLINTHWHGDHSGGNENLGKQGTIIMAHHQVRERMAVENTIQAFGMTIPASPKVALPVVTFGDDLHLHFNGETIRAKHLRPAHTDGDSVIRFVNANIIHTGDVWFNGFYPFIDVEHGGSLAGMINAATVIIDMADDETIIIPGHGPVASKVELAQYRDMLQTVLQRLRPLNEQGLTQAEMLATKPTEDLDAEWGDGFLNPEQWLSIVYSGLEVSDD